MNYVESIKKYPIGEQFAPWDVPESQLDGDNERPSVNDYADERIENRDFDGILCCVSNIYEDAIEDARNEHPNSEIEVYHCLNWVEYQLFGRTVREYYKTDRLYIDGSPTEADDLSFDNYEHIIEFVD